MIKFSPVVLQKISSQRKSLQLGRQTFIQLYNTQTNISNRSLEKLYLNHRFRLAKIQEKTGMRHFGETSNGRDEY